jgi:hypothetical protein
MSAGGDVIALSRPTSIETYFHESSGRLVCGDDMDLLRVLFTPAWYGSQYRWSLKIQNSQVPLFDLGVWRIHRQFDLDSRRVPRSQSRLYGTEAMDRRSKRSCFVSTCWHDAFLNQDLSVEYFVMVAGNFDRCRVRVRDSDAKSVAHRGSIFSAHLSSHSEPKS